MSQRILAGFTGQMCSCLLVNGLLHVYGAPEIQIEFSGVRWPGCCCRQKSIQKLIDWKIMWLWIWAGKKSPFVGFPEIYDSILWSSRSGNRLGSRHKNYYSSAAHRNIYVYWPNTAGCLNEYANTHIYFCAPQSCNNFYAYSPVDYHCDWTIILSRIFLGNQRREISSRPIFKVT